ncbi:MAG: LuxR C-terminal-related transcriptional regulator [Dongiaceae bacterium]
MLGIFPLRCSAERDRSATEKETGDVGKAALDGEIIEMLRESEVLEGWGGTGNDAARPAGAAMQNCTPEAAACVFLIDDDIGILRALTRIVELEGLMARPFVSIEQYLDEVDDEASGCLVLDHMMPGITGLDFFSYAVAHGSSRPTVFVSGSADIAVGVGAMKAGAVDFLVKPVDEIAFVDAIQVALNLDREQRRTASRRAHCMHLLATLTERERQVLNALVLGRLNKQIAGQLGIVEKTVKVHRARMYAKLGVRSVAELIRMLDFADQAIGACEAGYSLSQVQRPFSPSDAVKKWDDRVDRHRPSNPA